MSKYLDGVCKKTSQLRTLKDSLESDEYSDVIPSDTLSNNFIQYNLSPSLMLVSIFF